MTFWKPRVIAAVASMAVAAVLAACGSGSPQAGGDSGPIVLGVVISQTGALAPFDVPPYQGLQLAVADINAKGGIKGRKLKLVSYDIKNDFASGAVGAQSVIQQGASAVIVSCDFDRGAAAAFVATKAGKLTISLCAGSPKFGRQVISPLAFTAGTGTPAEGAILAEWAYKKGFRHPYILTDTSIQYDKDDCNYFEKRWAQLAGSGSVGQLDTFSNGDANIDSQVAGIRQAQPGFVVLCSYPPGGAAALRQIRAAGLNLPVVAGSAMDGTYWLNAVPNLSNFYFDTYASIMGDDPSSAVNAFYKRFAAKFGPALTSQPLVGYALVQLYERAVNLAGSVDATAVQKALESFTDVPTIAGPSTFTSTLHIDVRRPMAIMQVKNGKLSFLENYRVQQVPPVSFN